MVGSVITTGVLVAGLGLSTNMWVFFSLGLLIGITFATLNTPAFTIIQERVEPEMQGRVFGFVGIVMTVAMPLSMVVFGPLADQFSVESLLILAGVLLVGVLVAILALPGARRSLAQVDAAPEQADDEAGRADDEAEPNEPGVAAGPAEQAEPAQTAGADGR